ncbi:hypothetical protein [Kineococcus sp. NPDC059986]|uniref:hypothetical protein n=1 Tax=Kineococcus sp. NPDC059986 TaxID=3155538 RepID=UPI00344DAFC4
MSEVEELLQLVLQYGDARYTQGIWSQDNLPGSIEEYDSAMERAGERFAEIEERVSRLRA